MQNFPLDLLIAGIIVVIAWVLNLSVICAMRTLNSSSRVIYGFLSSLCVSNLFLATIDFPPSVISKILVSPSVLHVLCVSWTYLDTLLCNTALLHLLGCALDCHLRLRNPQQHRASTRPLPTCLKLSAPWTLAFLQATAFMAIAKLPPPTQKSPFRSSSSSSSSSLSSSSFNSPSDSGSLLSSASASSSSSSSSSLSSEIFSSSSNLLCSLPDPNFLILRSIMSFGLPILVSAILVFLSARGLQRVTLSVPPVSTGADGKSRRSSAPAVSQPFNVSSGGLQHQACYTLESSLDPTIDPTSSTLVRDETQETIANIDIDNFPNIAPGSATAAAAAAMTNPTYVSLYQHQCPRHGLLSFSLDKPLLPLIPIPMPSGGNTYDLTATTTPNTTMTTTTACTTINLTNNNDCVTANSINSTRASSCGPYNYAVHCPDVVPTTNNNNNNNTNHNNNNNNSHIQPSKSSTNISHNHNHNFSTLPTSHSMDIHHIYGNFTRLGSFDHSLPPLKQQSNRTVAAAAAAAGHRAGTPTTTGSVSNTAAAPSSSSTAAGAASVNIPPAPAPPTSSSSAAAARRSRASAATATATNHDRVAVAINLTLCIFSIILWGPHIIGSLIQGVCESPFCILPISAQRLVEFKWLSYTLCIIYPILFIVIDSDIRSVIRRSLTC